MKNRFFNIIKFINYFRQEEFYSQMYLHHNESIILVIIPKYLYKTKHKYIR